MAETSQADGADSMAGAPGGGGAAAAAVPEDEASEDERPAMFYLTSYKAVGGVGAGRSECLSQ